MAFPLLILLISHMGKVWKKSVFLILGICQSLWIYRKELWKKLVKCNGEWKTCLNLAASCMRPVTNHVVIQLTCACQWNVVIVFCIIYFTVLPVSSAVIIIPSGFCLRKQNHLGKSALLRSVSAGIKIICCKDEGGGKNTEYLVMGIADLRLQFSMRNKFYLITYCNVL